MGVEADDVIEWHGIVEQEVPEGIGQNEKVAVENRRMYKPSLFDRLL